MESRFNYAKLSHGGYNAMLGVKKYLAQCSVEAGLLHLVYMRASQINGCAFCLDMHWKDSIAEGESALRLYSLDAWRECPFYTDRERSALAWTEAVTRITQGHAPDAVYEEARAHLSEGEISDLTLAVSIMNAWNRLAIASRTIPGNYQPVKTSEAVVA